MFILPLFIGFLLLAPDIVEAPRVEAPTVIRSITIVPAPGEKIENGTIVIVGGRIVSVGKDAATPLGAREIDGSGLIAYAGFINGFDRTGVKAPAASAAEERRVEDDFDSVSEGPRVAIEKANRNGIFARRRVEDVLDVTDQTFDSARRAGFTNALLAPPQAVIGGRAALLDLGDAPLRRSVLRSEAAQLASFVPPGRHAIQDRGRWPATTFGVIAHWRQVMSDAQWYREMRAYVEKHAEARGQLPQDRDLEALQSVLACATPMAWEADSRDEILRALNLSGEFGIKPMLIGAGEAYKCLDQLKAANAPLIVDVKTPPKPREYKLDAESLFGGEDEDTSLYGKKWNKRPFDPKAVYDAARLQREEELKNVMALEKAGLSWCLATTDAKPAELVSTVREIIELGLPEDVALRALTVSPARILGVDGELGAIAVGKRANLTIMTKPLADKKGKVRWVFVNGRQFDIDASKKEKPEKGDKEKDEKSGAASKPTSQPTSAPAATSQSTSAGGTSAPTSASTSAPTSKPTSRPAGPTDDILLHQPEWSMEGDTDRDPGFKLGGRVLLKNAYVITVSSEDMPNTSVLVEGGKIVQISPNAVAGPGTTTIDLTGYVLMPGVIDPHSHISLDSVNEWSQSVTPEVRCADVIRSYDLSAYRALAGGCTTIHAMHGSANTIGGQCALIKLKHGKSAAEMFIKDAPRTVKFATGENVTRGGRPQRVPEDCHCEPPIRRFPGTRMGVETTMRRALAAGKRYAEERAEYEKAQRDGRDVPPPRRDLRLEALSDIVSGRIFVNCHCYRADEILRLLAVAEDFGIRIANLHHCLEAYRIMPEIKRHGAGTCTFSDWWAYKIEAFEAVPQNAGMLLRAGVNSMIKSDSGELMRHMPLEAAKCMKYSGLTPNEALRMVTLNAAKGFELDKRIGSIEVGKDADIAIYDGHPLDTFSKCVLTIIEGEVYFRHRDFDIKKPGAPARPLHVPAVTKEVRAAEQAHSVFAAAGTGAELTAQRAIPTNADDLFAITHATIHPVSGAVIEDGTLVIAGGKIAGIGKGLPTPVGAAVIDAAGRHVYPGLIDAATVVGLHEIDQIDVTQDANETGTYQPDVLAAAGFHPHSKMVNVTRADGVTTVHVIPGGPTVAGQSALLSLAGWTADEMMLQRAVGLVVTVPSGPVDPLLERRKKPDFEADEPEDESPKEEEVRRAQAELERFFRDAQVYARAQRTAAATKVASPLAADTRFDALVPYVLGEKPILFNAGGYKQILEALIFADKLKLKPIILGGRDAWKCADLLAKRKISVIYDSVFAMPSGVASLPTVSEAWDANYRALGVLERAGVKFCVANRSSTLAKQLPTDVGFAIAHGLSDEAGLRAITLSAAEILGVSETLGSLEVGKIANVVIGTEHPCQATNRVDYVFIDGRPVDLGSIHTENAARFAERPAPVLPPTRTDLRGPKSQSRE